jgi:hypothetical protein
LDNRVAHLSKSIASGIFGLALISTFRGFSKVEVSLSLYPFDVLNP